MVYPEKAPQIKLFFHNGRFEPYSEPGRVGPMESTINFLQ
jgi:hypothetical protein